MQSEYYPVLRRRGARNRNRKACAIDCDAMVLVHTLAVAAVVQAFALAPPGYEPIPELSDEFDGPVLDATKWSTNRQVISWPGRAPGLFDPTNVVVSNGSLQLWARAARRNASRRLDSTLVSTHAFGQNAPRVMTIHPNLPPYRIIPAYSL